MNGILEKLRLRGFQSHKDSTIEFCPGVNVIVGQSDSGKTAVMRALRWVIKNLPSGTDYVSYWADETTVDAFFSDGELSRKRDKKFNGYISSIVDDPLSSAKGVPEVVSNFLNFAEMNTQFQMDRPFMLDWSPGQRGAYINDIVNLQIVNNTIDAIQKILKEENAKVKSLKLDITEQKEEIETYDYLEDMEEDVSRAESYFDQVDSMKDKIEHIEELITAIDESEEVVENLSPIIKLEDKVEKALKNIEEIRKTDDEIEDIEVILEDVENENSTIETLETVLSLSKEIPAAEKLINELKKVEDEVVEITNLLRQIETVTEEIKKQKKEADNAEAEFNEIFPERCPLCDK